MSWVCPNCSNSNDEEQTSCFVCGMDRPASSAVSLSSEDDCKIVFLNFEAFKKSLRKLFRRRPDKTGSSEIGVTKPTKTERATKLERGKVEKPKTKKAKRFTSDFAKPWPEHKIKFDSAAIRAKGYIRSEQKSMGGINGYYFYKEDGTGQFIRLEMLLVQKMAHKV